MLKGFFPTWSNSVLMEVEAQAWDNTTVRNTSSAEAQSVPRPSEGYTHAGSEGEPQQAASHSVEVVLGLRGSSPRKGNIWLR